LKPNRSVPAVSVIPELPYSDVREAAEWLCRAFGFRERLQIGDHRAQLVYGDGAVIVIEGEAGPSHLLVRVEDADAHRAKAEAGGATIISEPTDWPYGRRPRRPPLDVLGVDRRRRPCRVGRNPEGVSGVEVAATSKGAGQ
jgi:hypothetical protein